MENVNVYDLVPQQIEELISKLQQALKVVKARKKTISKTACYEKEKMVCPHCQSEEVIKYGHTKEGVQNYKCKDCSKRFNALTGTIFSATRLTYNQIQIFLECFKDKISLRKTAKRMSVDKDTVFLLRQKMMDALKEIRENMKLSGEVECDETYESINLKGTKTEQMPRISKPRQSNGTATRGISSHKVCIASAIDEHDNMFMEIVGTGPITSNMAIQSLSQKLGKITKFITDCKSSYEKLAEDNKLNLKQIKAKGYIDSEGNSLANINSIHSEWSKFLSHFRGVSTKHLQGYLDWFCFDKYLNFSFEDDEQSKTLFKKSMTAPTTININTVYSNHSGLDFYQIYSDYHLI